MKSSGRQNALRGVLPADQRLETDHPPGAEIVDRLVEQEELLLLQRGVQLDLEHRRGPR